MYPLRNALRNGTVRGAEQHALHLDDGGFQVAELYRDSVAGDVWVLDRVHD
jgi:hypothetical protein